MAEFGMVGKLKRACENLARAPSRISKRLANALQERALDCYRNEADPYNVPWPSLAPSTIRRKGGNTVILSRSGASARAVYAKPLPGGGVTLVAGGASGWHMSPSGTRPARKVLPDRGIPPEWRADIAEVAGDEFAKALSRASR